jgi:hypothetical protein
MKIERCSRPRCRAVSSVNAVQEGPGALRTTHGQSKVNPGFARVKIFLTGFSTIFF